MVQTVNFRVIISNGLTVRERERPSVTSSVSSFSSRSQIYAFEKSNPMFILTLVRLFEFSYSLTIVSSPSSLSFTVSMIMFSQSEFMRE